MGCDIHMMAERKTIQGWQAIGEWSERYGIPWPWEPYDNRNYRVFGLLANVRNGYGVAGIEMGDAVVPIAEPRGLPEDADPRTIAWVSELADHSFSHVSLDEILAVDWGQSVRNTGVIPLTVDDGSEYARREGLTFDTFDAWHGGRPKSYSGGIFGRGITTVSAGQARFILASNVRPEGRVYVQVEWMESLRELCADFVEIIPTLQALSKAGDARLVFGFDS